MVMKSRKVFSHNLVYSNYLHEKNLDFRQQTFGWLQMKTDENIGCKAMKTNEERFDS